MLLEVPLLTEEEPGVPPQHQRKLFCRSLFKATLIRKDTFQVITLNPLGPLGMLAYIKITL
jgi:hypothetical protein